MHDNSGELRLDKRTKPWFQFETEPIWINIVGIIALYIIFLYSAITFPYWNYKFLFFWGYLVTHFSGLGVTAGAHRLWTHRAYKAKLPLRIILATFYITAGMNRIYDWVRDHRVHHKFSETDADPHNSNRGFWFAHVGWLMMRKHPEVYKRGASIDMSDIVADPVVSFCDRHFLILRILLCFVMPVIIPVYLFNQDWKMTFISQVFIRYPLVLNGTWSVNSFAHMFGYRSYDCTIRPAENLGVSVMTFGEGWHNYHHAFPWDYKAAEFGSMTKNSTTLWIDLFAKIGWAYDLKQASPDLVNKLSAAKGDGSYSTCHKD